MKKRTLALSKVYQLLEPGPVVMLSTYSKKGPDVMTMSWHMMIDFEPPIFACIISNRNYSFDILRKTRECVINIPTADLAKKVVAVGNSSGRDIDKFASFQLTQEKGSFVKAPLIKECFASLECRVIDTKMVEKYGMFIFEVVKAWIRNTKKEPKTLHHCGKGVFVIDGKKIKLPSRMK